MGFDHSSLPLLPPSLPPLTPQYKLPVARYPQNLARNTAKHGCPTAYTIVPDTDMIPIPGMAERLDSFLAKKQQQGGLGWAGPRVRYISHLRV